MFLDLPDGYLIKSYISHNRYESLLLLVDRDVIFPYWDMRMDAENGENAKDSYIFSDEFFGWTYRNNSEFEPWDLTRNVGEFGNTLMTYERVDQILNETSHMKILFHQNTTFDDVDSLIEIWHGGAHTFVGGHLGSLTTAAYDPIFFSLHNFVDYVWEVFLQNAVDRYVPDELNEFGHKSNDTVPEFYNLTLVDALGVPLTVFKNGDGLSKCWTRRFFRYEPAPTCPSCGSCEYLTCNTTTNRCRALLKSEIEANRKAKYPYAGVAPRLTKRAVTFNVPEPTCPKYGCSEQKPIQNTFILNGRSTFKNWEFLPVEILYKRPPGIRFNSYRLQNGKLETSEDIYDDSDIENKIEYKTYQFCHSSGSGTTQVFVNAYGLSYEGTSSEYAIVDQRLAVSSSYAYVPIKSPMADDRKIRFMLTAYDHCGRLCHAVCRRSDGSYKHCSGVITLTPGKVKYCQPDVSSTISGIWQTRTDDASPTAVDDTVCVKFICDSAAIFPWDR